MPSRGAGPGGEIFAPRASAGLGASSTLGVIDCFDELFALAQFRSHSPPRSLHVGRIGLVPSLLLTRNRGQSPSRWYGGMLASFPSLAAGSIPKSNVLRGSATSWKPLLRLLRHHPPEVALRLPPANGLIPPGSPCGRRPGRDDPLNAFRKLFSRIGRIGPNRTDRQETVEGLHAWGKVVCFPSVGSC
jgi:hypothetical protein